MNKRLEIMQKRLAPVTNWVDGFCGRLNNGLTAAAIVLGILTVMVAASRAVEALNQPYPIVYTEE